MTNKYIRRVYNLKYESVRIDSKTLVFIRASLGKKENHRQIRFACHFLTGLLHFCGSGELRKMACDQKFKFTITGKNYFVRDHCKHDGYIIGL